MAISISDYIINFLYKKIINISLTGKEFIKSNYTIIKGRDKYLLPGFSEMHFHNQNNFKNEFKLLIAN